MRKILLAILISTSINVFASDWQYAGGSVVNNVNEILFFDATKISKSNNTVKFWTKSFQQSKLNKLLDKPKSSTTIDLLAKKIASGYMPKYLSTSASKSVFDNKEKANQTLAQLVLYEHIVNSEFIQHKTTIYWELNCKNNTISSLDITSFDAKGNIEKSVSNKTNANYISPDSNAESWSEMFCN